MEKPESEESYQEDLGRYNTGKIIIRLSVLSFTSKHYNMIEIL